MEDSYNDDNMIVHFFFPRSVSLSLSLSPSVSFLFLSLYDKSHRKLADKHGSLCGAIVAGAFVRGHRCSDFHNQYNPNIYPIII